MAEVNSDIFRNTDLWYIYDVLYNGGGGGGVTQEEFFNAMKAIYNGKNLDGDEDLTDIYLFNRQWDDSDTPFYKSNGSGLSVFKRENGDSVFFDENVKSVFLDEAIKSVFKDSFNASAFLSGEEGDRSVFNDQAQGPIQNSVFKDENSAGVFCFLDDGGDKHSVFKDDLNKSVFVNSDGLPLSQILSDVRDEVLKIQNTPLNSNLSVENFNGASQADVKINFNNFLTANPNKRLVSASFYSIGALNFYCDAVFSNV